MVVIGHREGGRVVELDPDALRFIPDQHLESRAGAREAMRAYELIRRGRGSAPGELFLFRALHTCAFRASRRRASRARRAAWVRRWIVIRDALVERNVGLVWSMIAQFGYGNVERDEQGSAAMMALIKSVDAFNPWLGFKFSTYACNAIRRALILVAKKQSSRRVFVSLEFAEQAAQPEDGDPGLDLYTERVSRALEKNLGRLDDRETTVVRSRFPLDGGRSCTLSEIGNAMGLSKERVRQIQNVALTKLRKVLESDPVLQ